MILNVPAVYSEVGTVKSSQLIRLSEIFEKNRTLADRTDADRSGA